MRFKSMHIQKDFYWATFNFYTILMKSCILFEVHILLTALFPDHDWWFTCLFIRACAHIFVGDVEHRCIMEADLVQIQYEDITRHETSCIFKTSPVTPSTVISITVVLETVNFIHVFIKIERCTIENMGSSVHKFSPKGFIHVFTWSLRFAASNASSFGEIVGPSVMSPFIVGLCTTAILSLE